MVQVEKIATLRNKIAWHENFMMVQAIAAGTQRAEVKAERSDVEGGKREKFNDTALTSGKTEGLEGVWGSRENTKYVPYEIYDCDNMVSYRGGLNSLKV